MILLESRLLVVFALGVLEVEAWLRVEDGIRKRRNGSDAVVLPAAWRVVSRHGWRVWMRLAMRRNSWLGGIPGSWVFARARPVAAQQRA